MKNAPISQSPRNRYATIMRQADSDKLEQALLTQVKQVGIPTPVRQYKISEERGYIWDFAWPNYKLLVEVQGGTWTQGAHARPGGITRDCEKLNLAVLHGWYQLNFTSDMIKKGHAAKTILRYMEIHQHDDQV